MLMLHVGHRPPGRFLSIALAALLGGLPIAGCGRSDQAANAPGGMGGPGSPMPASPPPRRGLTTGQKVAILAGAAALYYLYKSHKNAQGEGKTGQYYLSKNGWVYYRDPKNPKIVHWVKPPSGGIQVPADEAQRYSRYQGYNNQQSGESFGGYGATAAPASGAPPGPPGPPGR
jgi:hypothetical protein